METSTVVFSSSSLFSTTSSCVLCVSDLDIFLVCLTGAPSSSSLSVSPSSPSSLLSRLACNAPNLPLRLPFSPSFSPQIRFITLTLVMPVPWIGILLVMVCKLCKAVPSSGVRVVLKLRVSKEERVVLSGIERDSARLGKSARSFSKSCKVILGRETSKGSGGV